MIYSYSKAVELPVSATALTALLNDPERYFPHGSHKNEQGHWSVREYFSPLRMPFAVEFTPTPTGNKTIARGTLVSIMSEWILEELSAVPGCPERCTAKEIATVQCPVLVYPLAKLLFRKFHLAEPQRFLMLVQEEKRKA